MTKPIRILAALLLISISGCQDSHRPTLWTGDAKAVSEVLADWSDVDKTDTSACQALFAKDVQPTVENIKKLREYNLLPNGDPRISGTSATYPVLIYDLKTKGQPTPMEWTFEKEGELWKFKNTPLP